MTIVPATGDDGPASRLNVAIYEGTFGMVTGSGRKGVGLIFVGSVAVGWWWGEIAVGIVWNLVERQRCLP